MCLKTLSERAVLSRRFPIPIEMLKSAELLNFERSPLSVGDENRSKLRLCDFIPVPSRNPLRRSRAASASGKMPIKNNRRKPAASPDRVYTFSHNSPINRVRNANATIRVFGKEPKIMANANELSTSDFLGSSVLLGYCLAMRKGCENT